MRTFHLTLASLTFLAFGLTGLYMHFVHDHLSHFDLALRAFYRSRHIYILFAALINAGIGAYIQTAVKLRWLQVVGSIFVTASSIALIVAFFVEPSVPELRSSVSALAIYAMTAGSLCHVIVGSISRK